MSDALRTGVRAGPAFVGWDQSLNHAGVVELNARGELVQVDWICEKAKACTRAAGDMIPALVRRMPDPDARQVARLRWVRAWIRVKLRVLAENNPSGVYVALEDYAHGAAMRAHQIGEVGGHVRAQACDTPGVFLRLHDPLSVKLFATGRGDATKEEVAEAVRERWGHDFGSLDKQVAEDLYDALALAHMARTEYMVRNGTSPLSALADGERRVFLRTTKARPVNLLDRPWLSKDSTAPG